MSQNSFIDVCRGGLTPSANPPTMSAQWMYGTPMDCVPTPVIPRAPCAVAPSRLVAKHSPPRLNLQPSQKTPAELARLAKKKAFADSRATHPDRAFSFHQLGSILQSTKSTEVDEYATLISEIGDSRIYLGAVVHTGKDYNAVTANATQNYLEHLGVTAVVCVLEKLPEQLLDHPNVFHVPVSDVSSTKLSDYFDETNAFINAQISLGKSVLVHCQMGISRSATILCAWLMTSFKMTARGAIDYLCEKRPQVDPNFGFVIQLQNLQKKLEKS